MNIESLHSNITANDILSRSDIIKEAFNNYDDAKFKRLSIFFYNRKAQDFIQVEGYSFSGDDSGYAYDHIPNYGKSAFQMFCGKIDDDLIFVDFSNLMFVHVKEEDADAYMSLFLNERRPMMTDNDFKPFEDMILRMIDDEDFEHIKFLKI